MTDRLTYAERDLMLSAVLAHAETQTPNTALAYAYMVGMIQGLLTDEQVRYLFRMTQK
jgi:hypothetical protein